MEYLKSQRLARIATAVSTQQEGSDSLMLYVYLFGLILMVNFHM